VTLCAQLGRSAAWVQRQIGHADMTTMQRYYLQASMSEIDPCMRGLVDYLLGEGQPRAGDGSDVRRERPARAIGLRPPDRLGVVAPLDLDEV
jgi:hypothetical protein